MLLSKPTTRSSQATSRDQAFSPPTPRLPSPSPVDDRSESIVLFDSLMETVLASGDAGAVLPVSPQFQDEVMSVNWFRDDGGMMQTWGDSASAHDPMIQPAALLATGTMDAQGCFTSMFGDAASPLSVGSDGTVAPTALHQLVRFSGTPTRTHTVLPPKTSTDVLLPTISLTPESLNALPPQQRRQIRNKLSARQFRARKKEHIEELERDVRAMAAELQSERTRRFELESENARLMNVVTGYRRQFGDLGELADEVRAIEDGMSRSPVPMVTATVQSPSSSDTPLFFDEVADKYAAGSASTKAKMLVPSAADIHKGGRFGAPGMSLGHPEIVEPWMRSHMLVGHALIDDHVPMEGFSVLSQKAKSPVPSCYMNRGSLLTIIYAALPHLITACLEVAACGEASIEDTTAAVASHLHSIEAGSYVAPHQPMRTSYSRPCIVSALLAKDAF